MVNFKNANESQIYCNGGNISVRIGKNLILIVMSVILSFVFCGCGYDFRADGNDRIKIVCTDFSQYDWVREITAGHSERFSISYITDNGADMHSYQMTAADIAAISTADMFVYVGGESEAWAEDVLFEAVNDEMVSLCLMDYLSEKLVEEEITEGMQGEHDHDHLDHDGHDHSDHDGHSDEAMEYDEHVWLSLKNADVIVEKLTEMISGLDEEFAADYRKNGDAYRDKLGLLDARFSDMVENASGDTLIFGDRFPFRYLLDDYNISYYAAFPGCSAETEAGFETITFLSGKADELDVPVILVIDGSDRRVAETILYNTKNRTAEILELDSLQSVSADEVKDGTTYYLVMEENLSVMERALGKR